MKQAQEYVLELGFVPIDLVQARCKTVFENRADIVVSGMLPDQGQSIVYHIINAYDFIIIC